MAEEGKFSTRAEVLRHAGAGASTTSNAEAYTNQYQAEAEALINVLCGYNWSDNYASANVDVKEILKLASNCFSAIGVIKYDQKATYSSTREAENLININWQVFNLCIKILTIHGRIEFMKKESNL